MKHKNLRILADNGFNVPHFIVINKPTEYGPTESSLLCNDKTYAVRSSFDVEDSNVASCAGQFLTKLNVKKQDIPQAITDVFNSAFNANVKQYQQAKDSGDVVDGAVIIQEMVDAEISGVLFTSNPNGALNEIVISVGYGLGCGIVEDKVETASYFYMKDDGVFYRNGSNSTPHLNNEQIKELIATATKIESLFSCPVDIEFAISNSEVYILQARPITTIRYDNMFILDNSNIVESYPGVSLPLTQDFVKSIYHEIFYNLLLRITKDKSTTDDMDQYLQNMVDVANWRIYYRISNWYAVLKLLPFSNRIIPIWQKMLGVSNKLVSLPSNFRVPLKIKFRIISSFLYYMKNAPKYMEKLNRDFLDKLPEYEKKISGSHSITDLLIVYQEIKDSILSEWDITLINDMYTFIYTYLAGDKNKNLISNIKNIESMKPVEQMQKLIYVAEKHGIDSDEYVKASNAYIEKYGDRCLCELKLETRTYRTDPDLLDEHVMAQMGRNIFEPKFDKGPQDKISIFAKCAKTGIENREISRLNRSRIFGLCRDIFLKIGDELVISEQIEQPNDVFYLHMNEIRTRKDCRELVKKRKQRKIMYESLPAYSRLIFNDRVINKTNSATNQQIVEDFDCLCGTPTSQGKATGEVLIINEPNGAIDTTGKIIVTKSTDPGWVFLVHKCAGIIAEKGSLLSHTAIISRELHKPAIVGVKDCTILLKTGDVIEMNAEDGTICVVKRGNQ